MLAVDERNGGKPTQAINALGWLPGGRDFKWFSACAKPTHENPASLQQEILCLGSATADPGAQRMAEATISDRIGPADAIGSWRDVTAPSARDIQRIEKDSMESRKRRSTEELLSVDSRMVKLPADGQRTIWHEGKMIPVASIRRQLHEEGGAATDLCGSSFEAITSTACYGPSRLEIVVVQ